MAWDYCAKVIICQGQDPDRHSNGHSGLLVLALFWPCGLAMWKDRDDKWTWVDHKRHYKDAIVHGGKIYATACNTLLCWELRGSSLKEAQVLTISNYGLLNINAKYLVEFRGKLLMVCDNREWGKHVPRMSVYELDLRSSTLLCRPLQSIVDHSMFLAMGYSHMTSTIGLHGAQGNCIYYVDDDYSYDKLGTITIPFSFQDSGVYNHKKRTYERFPIAHSPLLAWIWPSGVI